MTNKYDPSAPRPRGEPTTQISIYARDQAVIRALGGARNGHSATVVRAALDALRAANPQLDAIATAVEAAWESPIGQGKTPEEHQAILDAMKASG